MKIIKRSIPNAQRGFSLVELLVYMGVLSVFLAVMSSLFGAILDVQLDSNSTSGVDQDTRYIQSRMTYDMQRATSIISPSSGSTTSSMQVQVNGSTYTYSLDGSGDLQLNYGGNNYKLNSESTSVSGLSFQGVGSASNSATVRINYTVTSRIQESSGSESRAVQTTLSLQ